MTDSRIDQGNGVFTQVVAGRLQVKSPFCPEFLMFAHTQDGRWRKRSGIWSFKVRQYRAVALALNRIYGTSIEAK